MLLRNSGSCARAKGGRSKARNIQNHSDYMLASLSSPSTLGASCALNNNILNLATGGTAQQERHLYNSTVSKTGYQNPVPVANDEAVESNYPVVGGAKSVDDYE